MRLGEATPGDVLAVEQDGVARLVMVGEILCEHRRNKRLREPHGVMLIDVDPDTLFPVPGSWFVVGVELEVIEIVEAGAKRRAIAAEAYDAKLTRLGARHGDMRGGDVDPLMQQHRATDEDLPF